MDRHLTRIGVSISLLYSVVLIVLLWSRLSTFNELKLNEVGDFLAGIFGPLTVFWLVLGFFQQGVELRLNTRALELQATELQNSVEQQRELVAVANKQFKADLEAISLDRQRVEATLRPKIILEAVMKNTDLGGESTFIVQFRNMGHTVLKVSFHLDPEGTYLDPTEMASWESGAVVKLRVSMIDWTQRSRVLKVRYVAVSGAKGVRMFSFAPTTEAGHRQLGVDALDISEEDLASAL
jgi:hypothetical protein